MSPNPEASRQAWALEHKDERFKSIRQNRPLHYYYMVFVGDRISVIGLEACDPRDAYMTALDMAHNCKTFDQNDRRIGFYKPQEIKVKRVSRNEAIQWETVRRS